MDFSDKEILLNTPSNISTVIRQLATGYQASRALAVAVELGIADLLKDGAVSIADLAQQTKTDGPTLYRLMRTLAAIGVFHEEAQQKFSNNALGEALRSDGPGSLHRMVRFFGRESLWLSWGKLMHSVQTGENAAKEALGTDVWSYRESHPEENDIFNAAMQAMSSPTFGSSYNFGQHRVIADIGGGTGVLLAEILHQHPQCGGILFDQPHVVADAPEILANKGVVDRVRIEHGSFFETIPSGADAYLLRRILHNWDDPKALTILRQCRSAMQATARLLIIDLVVGPPNKDAQSKFSDLMMLVSPGGRERDLNEWQGLLSEAGFRMHAIHPSSSGPLIEAHPT